MNPVAEELTGWELEKAKSKPIQEVININKTKNGKAVKNKIDKVLKEKEIVGLAKYTHLFSKDDQKYQITGSTSPIKDNNGKIIGALVGSV